MANIKITQLTNQTAISDTDLVIVESATSTNKMTVGNLKSLLGIQQGGIEESGVNSNGSYIKLSDGTLICHHSVSWTGASQQMGSLTRSDVITWNFPLQFTFPPKVTHGIKSALAFGFSSLGSGATTSTNTTVCALSVNHFANVEIGLIAIGRWK